MYKFKSIKELESVFIEKISEKYKLNERDLKKAFIKFDYDNNGLLDLNELGNAVKHYVHGVNDSQVQELMQVYDQNGDGMISYEELLHYFTTRSTTQNNNSNNTTTTTMTMTANDRKSSFGRLSASSSQRVDDYKAKYFANKSGENSRSNDRNYELQNENDYDDNNNDNDNYDYESKDLFEDHSELQESPRQYDRENRNNIHNRRPSSSASTTSSVPSEMNPNDPRELESRTKVFFQSLHQYLLKLAQSSAVSSTTGDSRKIRDHLLLPHHVYLEKEGRGLLLKCFQNYIGPIDGGIKKSQSKQGIEFPDFCRVLRSFKLSGSNGLRQEVMEYIFSLCEIQDTIISNSFSSSSSQRPTSATSRVIRTEKQTTPMADPYTFVDLVFGSSGSVVPIATIPPKQSYIEQLDAGRAIVGQGPFPLSSGKDPVDHRDMKQDMNTNLSNTMNREAAAVVESTLAAIPLRVISHKTKQSLKAPASFSTDWLKRSAQLPNVTCTPDYIFGMSSSLQSGNTFNVLPNTIPSATVSSTTITSSGRRSVDYLDSITIVYAAAAFGVVHDLSTNTQRFYTGHHDDVTCCCLSPDGSLVATGCIASVGSPPLVHIWSTLSDCMLKVVIGLQTPPISSTSLSTSSSTAEIHRSDHTDRLTSHSSFFARSVNAMSFSNDSKYLLAIGCDDHHIMGIFDVSNGNKIIEAPVQHGIPPQINNVIWCPSNHFTEYISRQHSGPCDVFVTTGDHHLRLWSFRRPSVTFTTATTSATSTTTVAASLDYKAPKLGKLKGVSIPKVYTCCGFISNSANTTDKAASILPTII